MLAIDDEKSTALTQRFVDDVDAGVLEARIGPVPFTNADATRRRQQVVALIERLAALFVNREASRAEAKVNWVAVRPFGSSAINGDLATSDLDLYVRRFPSRAAFLLATERDRDKLVTEAGVAVRVRAITALRRENDDAKFVVSTRPVPVPAGTTVL